MKQTIQLVSLSFIAFLLCACAPFAPNSTHAGTCNELNSKLIFNGSGGTGNIRQAEIQDADKGLVQRTYDAKCDNN